MLVSGAKYCIRGAEVVKNYGLGAYRSRLQVTGDRVLHSHPFPFPCSHCQFPFLPLPKFKSYTSIATTGATIMTVVTETMVIRWDYPHLQYVTIPTWRGVRPKPK